jgi:geranylgeranyl pyrophosphate synthase
VTWPPALLVYPFFAAKEALAMFAEFVEQVFRLTRDFVRAHAPDPLQREILEFALEGPQMAELQDEPPIFVQVPLLVYGAITGDCRPALPLCVVSTLLYSGADILDDLADGDLSHRWSRYGRRQAQLAAATLISALPQLAIAELEAAPQCRALMHRTVASGLMAMAAGQVLDLAHCGQQHPDPERVELSVTRKSGDEVAMFAALAAQFAQAPAEVIDAYTEIGRAIGTAGQISSDCYDLFQAAHSSDLASGARTLPIAFYLTTRTPAECEELLGLIAAGVNGNGTIQAIRDRLCGAGVLRMCAFVIELHRSRALKRLATVKPVEPAASELHALIDKLSLFPRTNADLRGSMS